MNIDALYSKIKDELKAIRREIHQYPELGFEEFKTAETICSFLKKHNISYIDKIAKTGICATIGSGTKKVLLIRADMDALPTVENTNLEFASKNKGVMHACGHDIHICAALGAAYVLKQCENKIDGCVKIIFQPAEETTGGAKPMIDEGVLKNPKVTCAIGGHVTPSLETGKVWLKSGALMASPDDFCVNFIGKSTHGAEPQNGISPILPAAEFALNVEGCVLNAVTDDKHCVLSVCTISGGNSVNIIPQDTNVIGTFRSFSENSRNTAAHSIKKLADDIAAKHGAKAEVTYNFLYPPVINDEFITEKMKNVLKNSMGEENIIPLEKPLMTGEDFSYFANEVPSVFVWYGCCDGINTAPLHSDKFIADENAIEIGANIFIDFTKDYFKI